MKRISSFADFCKQAVVNENDDKYVFKQSGNKFDIVYTFDGKKYESESSYLMRNNYDVTQIIDKTNNFHFYLPDEIKTIKELVDAKDSFDAIQVTASGDKTTGKFKVVNIKVSVLKKPPLPPITDKKIPAPLLSGNR